MICYTRAGLTAEVPEITGQPLSVLRQSFIINCRHSAGTDNSTTCHCHALTTAGDRIAPNTTGKQFGQKNEEKGDVGERFPREKKHLYDG